MEFHPAAGLFSILEGKRFDELVEDIRQHGLQEPIVLLDGKILDGRNRWRACKEAAVEPRFNAIVAVDDPIAFVLSANLHRRHLTSNQRATAAADAEEMYEAERLTAKERQLEGQIRGGYIGGRGRPIASGNSLPEAIPDAGRTTEKVAAAFNTNREHLRIARILKDEDEELFKQVKEGTIGLREAARRSSAPRLNGYQSTFTAKKNGRAKKSPLPRRQGPGAEQRRIRDMERIVISLVQICLPLDDVPMPASLNADKREEFVQDLTEARKAIGRFIANIKEAEREQVV